MKKLFTNDKFFLAMVLCAVIDLLLHSALYISFQDSTHYTGIVTKLFCAIALACLFVSYNRHHKNVMKGMIGAVLGALLIDAFIELPTIGIPVEKVSLPVNVILTVVLFVNHFIINESHKASPKAIRLNQIVVILYAINQVVCNVLWMTCSTSAIGVVVGIGNIIGFPSLAASIVCVESRLDAYRLDREAAGWTEEAGYPEGYIHEYEKK